MKCSQIKKNTKTSGTETHLIKIGNDLIEQPKTLHALVVPVQLHVELVVVGDGGEDHAHSLVGLVVEVLPSAPLASDIGQRASGKPRWGVTDQ